VPVDPRVETGLELASLAIAMWPALRAVLSPPFRRAHVRPAIAAAAVVVGVGFVAAGLAARSPAGLRALAVVACGIRLFSLWLSRPGRGRSRRLPPGRLTLLPPVGAVEDERFFARQAAEHGPVFKIGGFRRNVVCVVGLERGAALLRRHDADLAVPAPPFDRVIPKGFLRFMSTADHAVYRRAVQRGLSRELVDTAEGSLRKAVTDTLTQLARASSRGGDVGVDPRPFLHALTFGALVELLLGVGTGDPAFERLARLYRDVDHLSVLPFAIRRARRAITAIAACLGDGAPGRCCALSQAVAAEPGLARDPTLIGNFVFMVRVGATDIAGLLSWMLSLLGDHPVWLARLRAGSPGGGATHDLASRVVTETLRLQQSEYLTRVTLAPIEVEGYVVPRRWAVRLCVHESHRDPGIFPRPDAFDPDRHLGRDAAPTELAPFGMDRHACLGEHLTRTLGRILVEELALGYDPAVAGSTPAEMGRALHWEPGRRFRVRLTERG
jgi:cytochrome P450